MTNKNKKIIGIVLFTLAGLFLLWLVWSHFDAQLNEIDTTIKELNEK